MVPRYPEVTGWRRTVAVFAMLMLVLSFTPIPFTHSSGREVWPEIRNDARDTLNSLRDSARHVLHRR
jgi:hypothetical protein